MNKIFWFKRKKDDYYFPVDSENQASKHLKQKNLQYVGWSDGSFFRQVTQGKLIKSSEDNWASQHEDGVRERRKAMMDEALVAEVEQAMSPGHQDQPNKMDVLNLNGKPHGDPSVAGMARRIR